MTKRFGPELAVALVIVMWASTYPITKQAFREFQPLAFTSIRFTIIIALSWVVLFIGRKGHWRSAIHVQRQDVPRFFFTGMLGYCTYQLGFALGVANTSPFSASLMVAMFPLVSLVLVRFLGEKQPTIVWIGSSISLFGVATFLLNGDSESKLLGNLLAFGGACSFAAYQVIGRPLVKRYSAETFACLTTTFGGVPLVLIGVPQLLAQDWSIVSTGSWTVLLYMAVFPAYIAYMMWAWAIRERGVAITIWSLLTPIISGCIAAVMTGEVFGAVKVAGAALALGGLLVIRLPGLLKRRVT